MRILISAVLVAISAVLISCGGGKKSENQTASNEPQEKVEVVESSDTVSVNENASEKVVNTPIHLTTAEFKAKVMNYDANPSTWKYIGDKPCIVDFWATWCPPCKAIAPVLDDLAKEYAGQVYIYKVDVDKEPQLAGAFRIQSIPTLLFVPMTGDPKAEVGAIPKETFKDRIDNFLLAKK